MGVDSCNLAESPLKVQKQKNMEGATHSTSELRRDGTHGKKKICASCCPCSQHRRTNFLSDNPETPVMQPAHTRRINEADDLVPNSRTDHSTKPLCRAFFLPTTQIATGPVVWSRRNGSCLFAHFGAVSRWPGAACSQCTTPHETELCALASGRAVSPDLVASSAAPQGY